MQQCYSKTAAHDSGGPYLAPQNSISCARRGSGIAVPSSTALVRVASAALYRSASSREWRKRVDSAGSLMTHHRCLLPAHQSSVRKWRRNSIIVKTIKHQQ